MSQPEIIPVNTPKALNAFIRFPRKIYRQNSHWVEPLHKDMRYLFQGNNHPFHQYGRLQPFLAIRKGEICGRIAAIFNPLHNQHHNEKAGFWGFFECIDDQQTADALFDKVRFVIGENNLRKLYGPANPSSNYEYGLLVDGFKDSPRIMMAYNPSYYQKLVEESGFQKARQLYAYKMAYNKLNEFPRLAALAKEAQARYGFDIRPVTRKNYMQMLRHIKYIYNQSWKANWGHVPFTEAEIDMIARELKPILEPELAMVAFKDGKPAGVVIAVRDINQVLKKMNGRLHLINTLRFLWLRRKIDWARILILGVLPAYRTMGLDAILYHKLVRSAGKLGIRYGEGSWVLDNNHRMNRTLSALRGTIYKRYHVYEKYLDE